MSARPAGHVRRCAAAARLAACALATLLACSKGDRDADLLPPEGVIPSAPAPLVESPAGPVRFGPGWYPIETDPRRSWRWMGPSGEIDLPALGRPARLRLVGWAPVDLLGASPRLRIALGDHELDALSPAAGPFERDYDVPADWQGPGPAAALHLHASATARPPHDERDLGFALSYLAWTPAP
ncbi:MAG TPA: hypothetical protein VE987_13870 [Polyangiaceae bacterium]|nr:hypothetical protein [Polyangiaceae bacterium]